MEDTSGRQPVTTQWPKVTRNDPVTVSRNGRIIYDGIVDDRTEDGATVWILPKNDHRQLVHITDGVQLSIGTSRS